MTADMLAAEARECWHRRQGIKWGCLDRSWSGRDARDLFAWAMTVFDLTLRAEAPGAELELVEGDVREPLALVVHQGDDHRTLEVQLRGSRLLQLRDDAGRLVASVVLTRSPVRFFQAVAGAVVGALGDMRAVAQGMELGL